MCNGKGTLKFSAALFITLVEKKNTTIAT